MFQIVRVFSDENGDSHFGEFAVDLEDHGDIGKLSKAIKAKEVIFREVVPTYDWDFHRAPQKQFIVLLDGEIEIETSLGEKRIFGAGDILLMEDTTGKGHKTRNVQPINRKSVFITLE